MPRRIHHRGFKTLAVATLVLCPWLMVSAQVFTNINSNLRSVFLSAAVAGDFDGDGKMDLLIEGIHGSFFLSTVWQNMGNGNFSDFAELNGPPSNQGAASGSVATGDFYNAGPF